MRSIQILIHISGATIAFFFCLICDIFGQSKWSDKIYQAAIGPRKTTTTYDLRKVYNDNRSYRLSKTDNRSYDNRRLTVTSPIGEVPQNNVLLGFPA